MTLHTDISIADYHASDHVSHSKLAAYDELGPLGYYGRYVSRNAPQLQTAAMVRGNQFEDFLMGWQPEVIPDELPDARGVVKPRKPDSEVVKRYLEEHPECVTAATLERYTRMRDAVMANATARAYLERAAAQVTMRCEYPGLPGLQSRPDFFVQDSFLGEVDLNLKTVDSLKQFKQSMRSFGYRQQAGLARHVAVSNGLNPEFYWLVAEVKYPHRAILYRVGETALATGEVWCTRKLDQLAEHYESDHWPPTVADVEEIDEPVYGVVLDEEAA